MASLKKCENKMQTSLQIFYIITSITTCFPLPELKKDDITPVYKNKEKYFEKKTVGELVLYQIFQMPIKDTCTIG